ncbi:MAG TPA: hypothetical protein VIT91_00235 [Chthoniobacterales bacterium]
MQNTTYIERIEMNIPTKAFGILAIATAFIGTSFAANGGATGSYQSRDIKGSVVTSTTIKPCPMMKPVYKFETVANPKINTTYRRLIGYKHEGCTGTSIANMKCAGSKTTCISMLQS